MRTRTRWLACLLLGGIAQLVLTPATVRAQDNQMANVRSPLTELPIPLMWGDRDEGFYVASEFLIMRRNNPLRDQALAFRGFVDPAGQLRGNPGSPLVSLFDTTNADAFLNQFFSQPGQPGAFIGSHEVALSAHDVGGERYEPGVRVAFGYRFRDGVTVEVNYMMLAENNMRASSGIVPRNQSFGNDFSNSFISAPFFNVSPQLFGNPNAVVSNVVPVPVPAGVTDVGVPAPDTAHPFGVFVSADELAQLRSLRGLALPAGSIFNAATEMYLSYIQNFETGEVLFRMPVYEGDDVRCYYLFGAKEVRTTDQFKWRTVDESITGEELPQFSATYSNKITNIMYGLQVGWGNEVYLGGGWALSAEGRVGLLGDDATSKAEIARGDNQFTIAHSQKQTNAVPMFQFGAYLWWYPIEGVQLRAGYEFLGMLNVLESPHPVDFDAGTLQPELKGTFLRLDGFNVGVSFIF